MKTNISEHITYEEATKTQTATRLGLMNDPDETTIISMRAVALAIFEPLRKHVDKPIHVSSFYRCHELNAAIGGVPSSQHCTGEAMDLDADTFGGLTNRDIFNYIRDNLKFDQLIWEFGDDNQPAWVHVSYSRIKNRNNVLRATKVAGNTRYIKL